jgi:hypothetical protein
MYHLLNVATHATYVLSITYKTHTNYSSKHQPAGIKDREEVSSLCVTN